MSFNGFPKIKTVPNEEARRMNAEDNAAKESVAAMTAGDPPEQAPAEEGVSDTAYEQLKADVRQLETQTQAYEKEMGRSEYVDGMNRIRDEIAQRLNRVMENRQAYPQFAEEIQRLEQTRGLKPGVTRDAPAISSVIGSSSAPYKGLQTIVSPEVIKEYRALSLAQRNKRTSEMPQDTYGELGRKQELLSAEEERRWIAQHKAA